MKPPSNYDNIALLSNDKPVSKGLGFKGCLIYTRVSTRQQAEEGYSLREQELSCRRLAKRRGYRILKVYREEGASGTTTSRPKFQEMLSRCSRDKNVKAVIVIHTDRFARNTLEHLTIKTLLKRYKVELLSVLQPMLDDSPEGNLMDVVLAGVNEFYSRDLGRKISKGMLQKVREGWCPTNASLGYLNVTDPKTGQRTIKIDQERGYYIAEAFQRFKTGAYSVQALIDELFKEGFRTRRGRKLTKSVMIDILRNIFYTGKIPYKNKIYQGKHKPLIDMETYTEVQGILALHNKGADRTRKHNFLLNGLLFCQVCGSQLTGEHHLKKSGRVFEYYRCIGTKDKQKNCHQSFSPMRDIESQAEYWLQSISLSEKYTTALKIALESIAASQGKVNQRKIKALKNRKHGIEKKMDRLEDQLLDGIMDEERITMKYLQLKGELKDVERQLHQAKNPKKRLNQEDIEKIISFVQNLKTIYCSFGKIKKKQLLKAIASKIWIRDKKIGKVDYTDIFRMIIERDLVRIRTEWWT